MQDTTLNYLKIGDCGVIKSINNNTTLKQRMLEIGFTKDTVVSVVRKSPAGDPTAYFIKGTVVALRDCDARNINVSLI